MEENTIRRCPRCGRPVSAEQKICKFCNSPINGKTCPYCGGWVDADATTCPDCDYSF